MSISLRNISFKNNQNILNGPHWNNEEQFSPVRQFRSGVVNNSHVVTHAESGRITSRLLQCRNQQQVGFILNSEFEN